MLQAGLRIFQINRDVGGAGGGEEARGGGRCTDREGGSIGGAAGWGPVGWFPTTLE